ncbi:MAG: hypothetical protein ABI304_00485 [Rudaea sp.]
MDRLDQALVCAIVAQGLARRLDPARDSSVGDHASIPHFLDEFIPGNQTFAIFNKQGKQGEYLRLDRSHLAIGAQFNLG